MVAAKIPTYKRAFKVADQIQRDLTELIARELKDPRLGMITIQSVEVSADYAHAKIFSVCWWVIRKAVREALNQALDFCAMAVQTLAYSYGADLHFLLDRTPERAADMNALIARAVASRVLDAD